MPTFPEPSHAWAQPATTWDEAISRYIGFAMTPSRRGVAGAEATSTDSAQRLHRKLTRLVAQLQQQRDWPPSPSALVQDDVERLLALRRSSHRRCDHGDALWDLWRTIVFDRHGYTCAYCHRSAVSTWMEPGRLTFRLALDHRSPKYRDHERDDFSLANIVLACRSCNHIKGAMPIDRFEQELRSLGEALARKYRLA